MNRAPTRFFAADGTEMASVTREQMLEIDRIAVEETGPSLAQMMENAGRSLAISVLKRLGPGARSARVLTVAGTGGNGGGGICAARHLAERVGGAAVCLTRPGSLSPMASLQLVIFEQTSGTLVDLDALSGAMHYDIVIDAVIGYGLEDAPRGPALEAIEWIHGSSADVISLDIPSGLDANTAASPGACVSARETLTLHLPKPGLVSAAAGDIAVADLGIPHEVTRRVGVEPPDYGPAFILPLRRG